MRIVREAKAEAGKDEATEEEATEGDGGEAQLTSGWMEAGEDDGQDERVTGKTNRRVRERASLRVQEWCIPSLIRSKDPEVTYHSASTC